MKSLIVGSIRVEADGKEAGYLPVLDMPDGSQIRIPVLVVKGVREGPILSVVAGVHGDEYEGVQAVIRVWRELDPGELKGTFIGVSSANPPAYSAGTRCNPIDGKNLARVFPGKPNGSITDRIAYTLFENVAREADYLIDLHSAGNIQRWMPLVGYRSGFKKSGESLELAKIFGINYVWRTEPHAGTLTTEAAKIGKICIGTETYGEGRCSEEEVERYARGVINVMRKVGMLEGEPEPPEEIKYVASLPGTDHGLIFTDKSGFVKPLVSLGEEVTEGQELALLTDLFGNELRIFKAPSDCVVLGFRTFPVVKPGDGVLFLGRYIGEDELL